MNDGGNQGQRGQSLIIVAALFLALIILAAIAADVTNAYYQRRTAQNAADAAALAAAQELGHHLRGETTTDADVLAVLEDFAARNQVDQVEGNYLDENETVVGQIGAGFIPADAFGVEAIAYVTASTFFGGVVGMDGYPLDAEAAVLFGQVCYGGDCLLPIAIYSGGFEDDSLYPGFVEDQCYHLWDGAGGPNFGWLNWSSQGSQYSCINYDVEAPPGDCSADCLDLNMNPAFCEDQPDDMVMIGDYVGGATGVKNAEALRYWLDDYIDNNRIARLVVYENIVDLGPAACGKTTWKDGEIHQQKGLHYVVAGFAAFRITGYRLSNGEGHAVMRDESPCLPGQDIIIDYPNADGQCCIEWIQVVDPDDGLTSFVCSEWEDPESETSECEVNRITGYAVPWTADAYDTCEGVGNFWAPMLTR